MIVIKLNKYTLSYPHISLVISESAKNSLFTGNKKGLKRRRKNLVKVKVRNNLTSKIKQTVANTSNTPEKFLKAQKYF